MSLSSLGSKIDALFHRRLLIVAGKGGVGKTTVACILALEAARRGRRVLLCEVDGLERAARLFGVKPAPVGQAVEVEPGISLMSVEGTEALAEYLQLIIPVRRLLATVFRSRIYRYFVAAAPGLKELMTIGKIWYEVERVDAASGERLRDLVILDAPATGHSLQYLRMPAAAREAFGAGLVNREARRLVERLTDPEITAVNLVTTAEEMPVNETATMFRELGDELGMPLGILFVNRVHSSDLDPADVGSLADAASLSRDPGVRDLLLAVAAHAREECGWTRVNAGYLARLAREVGMPRVELPFVFSETFGLAEIRTLAARLHSGRARGRRGEART